MTGQIVILAHDDDADAALLLKALQQAQPDLQSCIVRPEALTLARWHHEVDHKGHAKTRIRLPNRMELSDESVGCVLNRLRYVTHPGFARAAQRDRDYANAELQALVCRARKKSHQSSLALWCASGGIYAPLALHRQ